MPILMRAKVKFNGKMFAYALAINLSSGGMLLGATPTLGVGSRCDVILLGRNETPLSGHVVRSNASGVAIKFAQPVDASIVQSPAPKVDLLHLAQNPYIGGHVGRLGPVPLPDLTSIADVTLACLIGLLALPALLLGLLWVLGVDWGNPIFTQMRIGKNGKVFKIFKLRTMYRKTQSQDAHFCQKNDSRIIFGGHLLRKLRIDELPQLFNILLGDMALVGPRPEQEFFVNTYTETISSYNLRHVIKPGLTGLAQIRLGYVDSSPGTLNKLRYDLIYIRNRNIKTWLFVVFGTVKTVLCFGGR